MTELDTAVRRGLGRLVDATPLALPFDEVAGPRASKPSRRRRPLVRVGGGLAVALLVLGVPAITLEATNPFAHPYHQGDELTARYGVAVPKAERGGQGPIALPHGLTLVFEVERRHGLAPDPGEYLPTGPLGPLYVQVLGVHTNQPGYPGGVVAMTAHSGDIVAAAKAASGAHRSAPVHLGRIRGRLWRPWGVDDSLVISWQPSPTVGVLVATGPSPWTVSASRLEKVATQLRSLPHVPELGVPPSASLRGAGGSVNGYWPLRSARPGHLLPSAWASVVGTNPTLTNLLSHVVDHGSTAGQHWTARVTGDPATGDLSVGGFGASGPVPHPSLFHGLMVLTEAAAPWVEGRSGPPSVRLVQGSASQRVRAIRIGLSDGTVHTVRTTPSDLGWHRRLFATALHAQSAHVARIEGLDAKGRVIISTDDPLPLEGGVAAIGSSG